MTLFDVNDTPDTTGEPWPLAPFDRGMAASANAARRRWTPDELERVNQAIDAIAARLDTFTSDDVWAELGDGFPVTKGLASLLTAAKKRGVIASTGEVRMSSRGGDHDHGQRLVVWRSLIHEGDQQ